MARRRGNGEGSIFRRDDGTWCGAIRFTNSEGRPERKQVYGKTRAEVAERLKAIKHDLSAGVVTSSITVREYLDQWLEQSVKRRNRARTYDGYAAIVRNHLAPTLGHHQLAKLSPMHVQVMLNKLSDQGRSHRTIRNIRATLRRALNQALRFGYILRNVAALVDVPGEVTFQPEPLNDVQVRQLLDALKGHRYEALFRIALGLGLRKGEILGLRWVDVNFAQQTLQITGALQRVRGKLERSATKTAASVRTIALPPSLITMLEQHRQQQHELRDSTEDWTETGLVFTTLNGTPIDPSELSRMFKALLRKAALPEHIRLHDLRHSCATLLIAMDVHPRVVMEILGHSQISTTMNTHAHVLPRVQREAVNELDSLFASPPEPQPAPMPQPAPQPAPAPAAPRSTPQSSEQHSPDAVF